MLGIVEVLIRYGAITTIVKINIEERCAKIHLNVNMRYDLRAAF